MKTVRSIQLDEEKPKSYRNSSPKCCGNCKFLLRILENKDFIKETYCNYSTLMYPRPDYGSYAWKKWCKGREVFLDGVCDEHQYYWILEVRKRNE